MSFELYFTGDQRDVASKASTASNEASLASCEPPQYGDGKGFSVGNFDSSDWEAFDTDLDNIN